MLFAKSENHRVAGLIFLFSVLSFNFSNCFNYQELDTVRQIEVGLAAGKLPVAILADIFTVQDKKNAALVLKTIALAMDVSNIALKTYRHRGDISLFEYGYGAYDLFEIWNDIKKFRSKDDLKTEKLNNQIFDQEDINPAVAKKAIADGEKSKLKKLASYLLKYSFLAADSATSIAFTLDEKEGGSFRDMYSWLSCWSKVIASSINTKEAKVSSKIPVYLAGALVSSVIFTETIRFEKDKKSFIDSLKEPINNYKKEKKLRIKCLQNLAERTSEIEKDSDKDIQERKDAKLKRERTEKEIKQISKKISKLDDKLSNASNEDHIIKIIKLDYPELIGCFNPELRSRFE